MEMKPVEKPIEFEECTCSHDHRDATPRKMWFTPQDGPRFRTQVYVGVGEQRSFHMHIDAIQQMATELLDLVARVRASNVITFADLKPGEFFEFKNIYETIPAMKAVNAANVAYHAKGTIYMAPESEVRPMKLVEKFE